MSKCMYLSRRGLSGHTLLEMLLSLVLLSIVMASVGSAVMFASQAVPDDDSAIASLNRDSMLMSQIAEDIANAKYVIEQSATAITVVVSDRTGDDIPDRIRYAWSGVAGDPLMYQLNDAAATALTASVVRFELSYAAVSASRVVMGEHALEAATDIAKFTNDGLATHTDITSTDWLGQVVSPVPNSDHVSFKITEIMVYGHDDDEQSGSTQSAIAIEVHGYESESGPDAASYTTGVLEAQALRAQMEKAVISTSRPFLVGQDIALVCSRDPSYTLRTRLAHNPNADGGLLTSNNAGADWSTSALSSMLYCIKAIPTKQGNGFDLQRRRLSSVGITLQSGSVDRSALTRTVRMNQAPVVATVLWEANFSADPTQMDLDGDGAADWSYNGGAVPAGSLVDGELIADRPLSAEPMISYSSMVTADIRLRSETGEGPLVYGPNRLGNEGEMKDPYPLITQLRQDGAGGQELLFYNELTPTTPVARINDLPQGWIDLRLILLPDDQLVSIHVNGLEAGTLKLDKISDDTPDYTFALGAAGSDAIFDSARVVVGGTYTQMSGPAPIGVYALELLN